MGGQRIAIDLGAFPQVIISPVQEGPGPVKYTVLVKQAGKVLGKLDGVLTIRQDPPAAD